MLPFNIATVISMYLIKLRYMNTWNIKYTTQFPMIMPCFPPVLAFCSALMQVAQLCRMDYAEARDLHNYSNGLLNGGCGNALRVGQ